MNPAHPTSPPTSTAPYQSEGVLHVHFTQYWHAGSGRGSGYHLDALCERDTHGLPTLPGRQLKGVLRHAVRRAEAWGWLESLQPPPEGPLRDHETLIFGSLSQSEHRSATQPGMLRVASAHLPEREARWLAAPDQHAIRAELFAELFSTAINDQGSAQRYSLRGTEVCLPVSLQCTIALGLTATHDDLRAQQVAYLKGGSGWAALRAALPLIDTLGAHRSRGLGEVHLELIAPGQGA